MSTSATTTIPNRAETLEVLRLLRDNEPILMLSGDGEGYGTRWTIFGQQIQPAIARYLMKEGFIAESGTTEFGAKKLTLTSAGAEFRQDGMSWWSGLSILQKIKTTIFG
jgi:hypothetical protein